MTTSQSESWTFNNISPQSHQNSQPAAAPQPPPFIPHQAVVQTALIVYPENSLLGIAAEVRHHVLEHVQTLIETQRQAAWSSKPKTDFDTLPLVCRQLYHEVQDYWHRSIVPCNRLNSFLDQTYRRSVFDNFKSLSLELQFSTTSGSYAALLRMLNDIAPRLENLQFFFTGYDVYCTRVYLHGCGNKLEEGLSRERKLPQDGQDFEKRFPLINAIATLANLKTLVLSNLNMPVYQPQIIKNKPRLQKLCVVSDPRTTLHFPRQRRYLREGLLVPVHDNFPPVKELYLSANAAPGAVQIPGKLSVTLEKLTWVVPNVARQAGSIAPRWHEETGILLRNLRSNSRRLHTLRICMEGSFYEGNESYGDMIGSFREHMPRITSLKNLELHLWSKSPFIAQEFIYALPLSLSRFYLSDKLAPCRELLKRIRDRYLPSERNQTRPEHVEYFKAQDETEIRPVEELKRQDYITLQRGNLGFVTYEFTGDLGQRFRVVEATDKRYFDGDLSNTGHQHPTESDSTSLLVSVLNGQLLDRELNSHLAMHRPGTHTPPVIQFPSTRARTPEQLLSDLSIEEKDEDVQMSAHDVGSCAEIDMDTLKADDDFQSDSAITDDEAKFQFPESPYDDYFGHEDDAEKVFAAECVRNPTQTWQRKYPLVVLCTSGYEDHEHWMCD